MIFNKKINFSEIILKWHMKYGRKNLPWQKKKTLYSVWISEIMLQQTQVLTVIRYFDKFMHYFPNIETLSTSSEDEILFLWTGLGYYKRAINLHKTAKKITKEYNGIFPKNFQQVLSLPGIGRSTAGAILSICCDQKFPILDGNVKRVLTRFYGIEGIKGSTIFEKKLWLIAEKLIPKKSVGVYNQAMMDLGSSVCVHFNPKCEICPLNFSCLAFKNNLWNKYPYTNTKKNIPKKKAWFLLLQKKNFVFLIKRPSTGFWSNLYSFPQFNCLLDLKKWIKKNAINDIELNEMPIIFHKFSHFYLKIIPIHLKYMSDKNLTIKNISLWYNLLNPPLVGLPTPIKNLLNIIKDNKTFFN